MLVEFGIEILSILLSVVYGVVDNGEGFLAGSVFLVLGFYYKFEK